MLPIVWNLSGRQVLLVGGGTVASRKGRVLCEAGAAVRAVAPHARPAEFPCASWHEADYAATHLDGMACVVAAATGAVNRAVVADARAARIPVASATDPAAGDFTFPAVVRRGRFTLAVATGGAAPAFARRVREKLLGEFDAAYGEFVALLEDVRSEVATSVADPASRRRWHEQFADWPWLARVRLEGPAAVREAMFRELRLALARKAE